MLLDLLYKQPMLKSKMPSCKPKAWRATLLLVLALVLTAGCGSGGGTDSSGSSTASSASGATSFAKDAKSKEIVGFGEEAGASDREAASAVLSENLKARQAADFADQCRSLGKAGLETVLNAIKEVKAARAKCPSELKSLAEPLQGSKSVRADTLTGPIAALRIKGNKAYALYHGSDGNDYAMPMEKEGGKWLVGSIVTTQLE